MKTVNNTAICTLLAGAALLQVTNAAQVRQSAPSADKPATLYMWDQAYGLDPQKKVHVYKDDSNPYVQEVNVSLRSQYQAGWVDGQVGNYDGSHNWTSEFRRFRMGWNAKVLHDFKLQNVWNVGGVQNNGSWNKTTKRWDDHGQTKASLYEAFVQYNYKNEGYTFSFGKTNPEIFAENRVSSGSFKVPEMTIAEQTLCFDSVWGLWAANDTKKDDLGYYVGLWSSTNDSNKQIWGTWQSCFTTAELSYGLDKVLLEKGRFYVDWIHSFADADKPLAGSSESYVGPGSEDVVSAYYIGKQGAFEVTCEALWGLNANDRNSGDLFGFMILPSYNVNDHVELVSRFQYATGDNAVNVGKNRYVKSLQRRSPGYADDYYAIGGGVNFYVYGKDHSRLKIMTMLEYGNSTVADSRKASNAGFTGWQFICGIYTSF